MKRCFVVGALRASVSSRAIILALSALAVNPALAGGTLPISGQYIAGKGTIAKTGSKGLSIDQTSTSGIIDWKSFSIGKKNSVDFNNGSGATLNRVTGGNLSSIAGSLHATGSVYVINSAGVVVGKNGRIDTGGTFTASSGDTSDSDFMGGTRKLKFTGARGNILNRGSIASNAGDVILIGHAVKNTGSLSAAHGTASLDAGTNVTLAPAGTSGRILVGGGHGNATNSGTIAAAQAQINAAGGNVYALGGNNGGIIRATGTKTMQGRIWLTSNTGETAVAGKEVARNADGSGGFIETSGNRISASGHIDAGKGGKWLIDPVNLTVDEDAAATIATSLNAGTNVTLKTAKKSASGPGNQTSGAGDIVIDAGLSWSGTAKLTLEAYHSIDIDAPIALTGKGKVSLLTDNGGTDGQLGFGNGGDISFTKASSALTINGTAYTLVNNIATLAADITSNASGDYALMANYDASQDNGGNAYTTTPVSTAFQGTFEGLGNSISNLAIASSGKDVGLFETIASGGTVADLHLANASVTSTSSAKGTAVGALAAINGGTLRNDTVSGNITANGDIGGAHITSAVQAINVGGLAGMNNADITGSSSSAIVASPNGTRADVGGLVGYSEGSDSSVSDSNATGSATGNGALAQVGGLIGWDEGSIWDSYATGTISGSAGGDYGGLIGMLLGDVTGSYATGAITISGGSGANLGGLVGRNSGGISDSYAIGNVTSGTTSGSSSTVFGGGFLGVNTGTVQSSYSIGAVTGANKSRDGGFVGDNASGTIDESYAYGKVTVGSGSFAGGFAGENGNAAGISASIGNYYNKTANSGAAIGSDAAQSSNVHALTAAKMLKASNYTEWSDFGTHGGTEGWVIVDANGTLNNASGTAGGTLPMLLTEYSNVITNAHQLQLMALNFTADYTLASDVDASGTSGGDVWAAAGFIPVGGNGLSTGFTGVFDGAGHTIDGLFIDFNTPTTIGAWAGEAGLFGFVDATGVIENVGVTNANVTAGNRMNAGILVGNLEGSALNSYSTGTSTAGDAEVVQDSTTAAIASDAGGLIGAIFHGAKVDNDYSTATVVVGKSSAAGGLIGGLYEGGTVENSHATGSVTGGNDSFTTMGHGSSAGGLIGYVDNDPALETGTNLISNDFATGKVKAGSSGSAGGLIGGTNGAATIDDSYATGKASTGNGSSSTTGFSIAGGLLGDMVATSDGKTASLDQSYATGAVSGGSTSLDGGLVGYTQGTITNSLATGAVHTAGSGSNYSLGGGLIGYADTGASIKTSYSTGAVTGTVSQLGGLAGGENTGVTFKNDYWDTTTSGIASANGVGGVANAPNVTGKTSAQLQNKLPSGFSSSIWGIDPSVNDGLPYLKALAGTF